MKETQPTNQNQLENFTVMIDGEPTNDYDPSALELARQSVFGGLSRVVDHLKLEARMIAFDALHNTNYRQIRHELVARKKHEQFEQSIGLVAVGKK